MHLASRDFIQITHLKKCLLDHACKLGANRTSSVKENTNPTTNTRAVKNKKAWFTPRKSTLPSYSQTVIVNPFRSLGLVNERAVMTVRNTLA